MNCTTICTNDLRHKVVIERFTETPDGMGGKVKNWTADPAGGVWASLKNLTGTERWEAHRIMPGNLLRCFIRWRGDVSGNPYYSTQDRLIYNGRYYTILAIFDVEHRREFLQLDIQEGKP